MGKQKRKQHRQVEKKTTRKPSQNEDSVVLETKQLIDARNKYYDRKYSPVTYRSMLATFIISVSLTAIYLFLVLSNLTSLIKPLITFLICLSVIGAFGSINERLRRKAALSTGKEREKLLWRMGQFQAIYRPIVAGSTIYILYSVNETANTILISTLSITIGVAYLVYSIVMLIVLRNLKLFLSKPVGAIGSLFVTIAYLGFYMGFFIYIYYLFLSSGNLIIVLLGLIGIFGLLARWKLILTPVIVTFQTLFAKRMNYIQLQTLMVVPLGMILSEINNNYQILKDKKDAIAARLELYETLSEGAQYQLIKLVAEDGKSMQISYTWFFAALVAFIGFVGSVVGIFADWQDFTTIIKSIFSR